MKNKLKKLLSKVFTKKYYFISSVRQVVNENTLISTTDTRCWGFFTSKKKAIKAVTENWTDINEDGYYPYAVIETYTEGLISGMNEVLWFEEHYEKMSDQEIKDLYYKLPEEYRKNAKLNTYNNRVTWQDEDGWHSNFAGYVPIEQPIWAKGWCAWSIG